jgi:hypothetical protein
MLNAYDDVLPSNIADSKGSIEDEHLPFFLGQKHKTPAFNRDKTNPMTIEDTISENSVSDK